MTADNRAEYYPHLPKCWCKEASMTDTDQQAEARRIANKQGDALGAGYPLKEGTLDYGTTCALEALRVGQNGMICPQCGTTMRVNEDRTYDRGVEQGRRALIEEALRADLGSPKAYEWLHEQLDRLAADGGSE